MGRKKSVVLMVLLSIVIVALCVLAVFPAFTFPWDKVKGWKPALSSLDAGAELRGGYYTYYYPQGVISASEFEENCASYQTDEEKQEYADKYVAHKGLYLEVDETLGIFEDEAQSVGGVANVSDTFKEKFAKVTEEVNNRFAKKGFSQYRLSVVDDYVLRVEVPAPNKHTDTVDENATTALGAFAEMGELTIKKGSEDIPELLAAESLTDYVKKFSVETEYGYAYIVATLTDAGKSLFGGMEDDLSAYGESDGTFLVFSVGDNALMNVGNDNITSDTRIKYPVSVEENKAQVETHVILLNSALQTGGFDFSFVTADVLEVEDGNQMLFVYIALGVALLALLILPIVFFGKYGVVSGYTTLSYLIVTVLCFAFITGGIFEITLGSLLIFLFGLVLVNGFNAYIYQAIKKEFMTGKTVASSVKKGYGKTLWHVIDTYAVLLLGALALLIGTGGLSAFAPQALICIVTAAFCNLLWGRGINYVFLSACKNKYKYFRFVREDDDDEE